jgi:glycosyltransferase involved in cell wall biosynthesis
VYEEADAILFPVQWEEPWGLVPLEAMAVGRPVVATGTGGSREYLADGENCLLFDRAGGGPALAAALHRLAGDEDLRLAIRNGGMATAARFTERDYCEAIEDAIVGAAGRSAPT